MLKLDPIKKYTPSDLKKMLVAHFSSQDSYFIRQDRMAIEVLLPYRRMSVEEVTGAMSKEFRQLVSVYPVEYGQDLTMVKDVVSGEVAPLNVIRITIKH